MKRCRTRSRLRVVLAYPSLGGIAGDVAKCPLQLVVYHCAEPSSCYGTIYFLGSQMLFALSSEAPGASIALKIFFACIDLLLIAAGIYLIYCRDKLFGWKGSEGDTRASANLRMAMLVIIWIHAIILNTIMIFEV